MRETLLPVATIATPNLDELQRLVPDSEYTDKQAEVLLAEGCGQLLVTGGDADTDRIENVHFAPASTRQSFQWARIQGPREGRFHGTGCTLASAIAALLAKGEDMRSALRWAQTFVAHTLESAVTPGNGQAFPNRLFSIDGN
ncbi:MAG: bifunctional hydroxymethylpyrimidine kinase/phosphomethylpyrimidine kinase [Gammaproteobacteria bacterium]